MKKYSLFTPTLILVVLFLKLLANYSERFEIVESYYNENSSINLNKGVSFDNLSNVLFTHNYISDKEDAVFASEFIIQKLDEGLQLSNLYDINKRVWQIPVSRIDSIGSNAYRLKAKLSEENIGIDEEFRNIDTSQLISSIEVSPGKRGNLNVKVIEKVGSFSKSSRPCENVIVRLSEQCIDSLDNTTRRTIAFLKTDEEGKVSFKGLDPSLSYSVLPIKKGFEYGVTQGTLGGSLSKYTDKKLDCEFTQQEHKIRIFDAQTVKQIKEEQTITIRTPEDYKKILAMYVVLFFAAWWGLWLWGRRKRMALNNTILATLMSLSGLCLLTMFSLNDPLTDKLLGVDMAQGIIAGVVFIALLLNVNFKKLYQDQSPIGFDVPLECIKWLFKPYRVKVSYCTKKLSNPKIGFFSKCLAILCIIVCSPLLLLDLFKVTSVSNSISRLLDRLPKGSGYLLTAVFLTALLFTPLGQEVGGMKVNLNIGFLFQPSEIAKYLIIFFMASYFSVNANRIIQFSGKGNTKLFGAKLKMLASIFIGLGVLMGLYLILGDMGPALVLAFTFIILYSIIKSKIDLEGITSENQIKRIFTCDFAMLVYGILSFVVFLYIGKVIGNMGIFCMAWFAIWIIIGILKKQVYETPMFFNFIVAAFIFGGSVLENIPISKLNKVADRLESRNEMCANTWGTLPISGNIADPGENTQVADGLWGLASGGILGQGLGNGSPHFIPAFHTDMILESIGEQMGFWGISLVILLLTILLWKAIVLGYKTSHPFTFYLCTGIAIVTAIQFIIISLGSTGVIPLTGVTVPFFSYGKVSMILNLAAYGVILSIATHNEDCAVPVNEITAKLVKQNIGKYNYSISLLSWAYCIIAAFICCVFFNYQFIEQNKILIKPVYVNDPNGRPVVNYNPRITQLTYKMHSGDIYDRNGLLLATSDKSKLRDPSKVLDLGHIMCDTLKRVQRYYPFGEHLYFMIGDYNSKLFFSSSDNDIYSRGYMAEARYLSELRGYDNELKNKNGESVKVDLYSDNYQPGKFYSSNYKISQKGIQLRDYSPLIPYLKAGLNSDKITRLNNRKTGFWEIGAIKPKDIQLTVDAKLQTKLQEKLKEYKEKKYSSNLWNKCRISVVVVDAKNGDMLASANYPLPDFEKLKDHNISNNYSDNYTDGSFIAYTERDLGLTRPTAPGSTAKVMSALAGLRKLGVKCANPNDKHYSYWVYEGQKTGLEPSGHRITMEEAIVASSNCYFINLINDYDLYDDLAFIYKTVGVQLNGDTPYVFNYSDCLSTNNLEEFVKKNSAPAISEYKRYIENGRKDKMAKHSAWYWAWGQGALWATPMAIARASSIVANNGEMPVTRFLLNEETKVIPVVSDNEAARLNYFMKEEAIVKSKNAKNLNNPNIGAKTGTAERDFWNDKNIKSKPNDAWFACFIEGSTIKNRNIDENEYKVKTNVPIVCVVRIERAGSRMSDLAVEFTDQVVLPVLDELGYYSM